MVAVFVGNKDGINGPWLDTHFCQSDRQTGPGKADIYQDRLAAGTQDRAIA
jgi:hypothetical protein